MEQGKDARQGWSDGVSDSWIISGWLPLGELVLSFGKAIRQKREKDVRGITTLLFSWKDQISAHELIRQFWKPVRIQERGQVKLFFYCVWQEKKNQIFSTSYMQILSSCLRAYVLIIFYKANFWWNPIYYFLID